MYASTPVPATTERNGPNKISKLHSNAKFEIISNFFLGKPLTKGTMKGLVCNYLIHEKYRKL